ncbi:MAG: hypothetical protein AAGU11_08280 [Syntrophobacteraceae bacterium]
MDQLGSSESKFFLRLTLVVFIACLWMPILQMGFNFFPEVESTEKRTLSSRPELVSLSMGELKKFIPDYEKFFNERFGFRNSLVRWNNFIRTKILRVQQPIPDIVIGKDGWMFFNSTKDGINMKDYCGLVPYSPVQLSEIRSSIEKDHALFKKKGILYVIVVSPSKHSIYPEHLPESIVRVSDRTRLDQVAEHLAGNPEVHFLDLRAPLLEAKRSFPVYYKTDTHWNRFGSFIGYREIMKHLSRTYPELQPRDLSDYIIRFHPNSAAGGDLAEMLSLKGMLRDDAVTVRSREPSHSRLVDLVEFGDRKQCAVRKFVSENPNCSSIRFLMLHDSFGNGLMGYLPEHFANSTFVTGMYESPNKSIDDEKPDIVVLELTERFLDSLRSPLFAGRP